MTQYMLPFTDRFVSEEKEEKVSCCRSKRLVVMTNVKDGYDITKATIVI